MKTFGILLLALIFADRSLGQLSKDTWLAGGTGLLSSTKATNASIVEQHTTTIQLSPNFAYFLMDRVAAGARLSFASSRYETSYSFSSSDVRHTSYIIGPFIRYYFLPIKKRLNILIDGSYQFETARARIATIRPGELADISTIRQNKKTFAIAAGPVLYINSSVGLEFLLNYSSLTYVDAGTDVNTLRLGIGLQVHIGDSM